MAGLKSAKQKKILYCKQTAMHRQGNHVMNASQDSAFHKFGTGLTLL